jgi:hypothetical protein
MERNQMRKFGPTQTEYDTLVDVMCQVLNDAAEGGKINRLVHARARIAFEPFALDDNGDMMDLEAAREIVAALEPVV